MSGKLINILNLGKLLNSKNNLVILFVLFQLISMMHQNEIFDSAPFNFEMVFARLLKFDQHSSKTMTVDRQVVVKAFEHLKVFYSFGFLSLLLDRVFLTLIE